MFRNILLAILIIFLAACSKPKVETQPGWYTQVPVDYKYFYAVAKADTVDKAKKIAIVNMRTSLNQQVDARFEDKNHPLKNIDKVLLEKIKAYNKEVANRLALSRVKIEKTKRFNGKELVLIRIARKDLFSRIKVISDVKLHRAKEADKKAINKTVIDRYIALDLAMKEWVVLASLAEYKDFLISTYDASDEFTFLKKIKSQYDSLKNSITFYVLTDGNSRIFSSSIKNAILKEGLHVGSDTKSKNSFKLLLTSKTEQSQDYTFNQSKTLVKLSTFDNEKNKIKFRQHTFIGKSRKSYKEAKEQAAIHFKYKIKKLGFFDFIGFSKQ